MVTRSLFPFGVKCFCGHFNKRILCTENLNPLCCFQYIIWSFVDNLFWTKLVVAVIVMTFFAFLRDRQVKNKLSYFMSTSYSGWSKSFLERANKEYLPKQLPRKELCRVVQCEVRVWSNFSTNKNLDACRKFPAEIFPPFFQRAGAGRRCRTRVAVCFLFLFLHFWDALFRLLGYISQSWTKRHNLAQHAPKLEK